MTVAYLKAAGGAREIIKDKPDLIVASYTAYEDIAMLLKSTGRTLRRHRRREQERTKARRRGPDRPLPGHPLRPLPVRPDGGHGGIAGLGEDLTARITGDTDALLAELTAPADGDAADECSPKLVFNILSMARVITGMGPGTESSRRASGTSPRRCRALRPARRLHRPVAPYRRARPV